MDLDEIFNRYGTDKDRNGYTHVYHAIFKSLRNSPLDILEVGIGTMIPGVRSSMLGYSLPGYRPGGSLRAWRDYFPQAKIHGMDVQPDTQFTEDRIETYLCDSTSAADVSALLERAPHLMFDAIIDDGSHLDEHQLSTLRNLFPRVKNGGYYIIEDIYPGSGILTNHWEQVRAIIGSAFVFVTAAKNLAVISRR